MPRQVRQFSPPAFEPDVSLCDRKARGVYYTPPEIARQIVDLTLGPLLHTRGQHSRIIRVLDPSCGAGEFLVAAFEYVRKSLGIEAARDGMWGIDIDSSAVHVARSRLLTLDSRFPTEQIVTGNTLRAPSIPTGSFDAIIGNPPYVNIRQLAKTQLTSEIEVLRQSYSTARGNFDLYVLFIERAIELLRPGGRCGFIIPSKWATLDYARECRKLLLSQTMIEHVLDLSDSKVFAAASVYPHILIFKKAVATQPHAINVGGFGDQSAIAVRQASLAEQAIQFSRPLDVELRVSTAPLGSVATIRCGTAGYAAQKIAQRIVDVSDIKAGDSREAIDFITSGNIDRYRIQLGNVRYLNRRYVRPKLPLTATELTETKRQIFASQKIVVAGMSRRLEAAWDGDGLALGVQVYAITDFQVDPHYLLAVLNSKLLSYLFAIRFAAKRLSGGYLAINKGQLTQLPICLPIAGDRCDERKNRRLSELSRNWSSSHNTAIDQLVYELYRLTGSEIARVEGHFAKLAARAA
ncbi:MAG TPA: N-6 DNA methylase [Pirellulaceae bacterium]|jgi:SAM-dependent methyltransferase